MFKASYRKAAVRCVFPNWTPGQFVAVRLLVGVLYKNVFIYTLTTQVKLYFESFNLEEGVDISREMLTGWEKNVVRAKLKDIH